MDETWRNELSEFLAIPSVSADPAHREDVKRGRRMGLRLHPAHRRHRRFDAVRREGARARRDPGVDRSGERADRARLRPLRRAAARAARPLGERPVRAHDQGRVGLRARNRGRQGAGLHPVEGGAAARRGERASGQPALRVRRRGGDRRSHDRRLARHRRARCECGHHLRRRHGAHGRAAVQPRRRAV